MREGRAMRHGGQVTIHGGTPPAGNGCGGNVTIKAGTGAGTGVGGNITITGGGGLTDKEIIWNACQEIEKENEDKERELAATGYKFP